MPRPIVVAGAGIAGLGAAISLARAGSRVVVLERAAHLGELGAGLQLAPNATRVLREWGVLDRILPCSGRPEALLVRNALSGKVLARMPLGEAAEARWRAPYLTVHRGDLQNALLATLADETGVELRLAAPVEGFATTPSGVVVRLVGGDEELAAGLVGADGLHSSVRTILLDDRPPRSGSTQALRALIPATAVDPALARETGLWLGAGAHFVHYPVRSGRELNLVLVTRGRGARAETVAASWAAPARDLIAAAQAWTEWPIERRPPAPTLPKGLVTLIGDAWHPAPPHLAQGAALAIEDAAALSAAVGSEADMSAAFAAYAAKRLARVRSAARASAFNGIAFGLPWPASTARDLAIVALGGEGLARRYDWLYAGPGA